MAAERMRRPRPAFGVVAEDDTDFRVARVLIHRLGGEELTVRRRVTNGSGKLEQKLGIWQSQLAQDGCQALIVLRDLDRNALNALHDESALRRKLERAALPAGVRRLICIPIEELEAWFWSDPRVVQKVGRGQGKASASPHRIVRPKEELIRLSRQAHGRPLYSTNDNEELARLLDLERCARCCDSFRDFRDFVLEELR
jgi:hypothetical protein